MSPFSLPSFHFRIPGHSLWLPVPHQASQTLILCCSVAQKTTVMGSADHLGVPLSSLPVSLLLGCLVAFFLMPRGRGNVWYLRFFTSSTTLASPTSPFLLPCLFIHLPPAHRMDTALSLAAPADPFSKCPLSLGGPFHLSWPLDVASHNADEKVEAERGKEACQG